MVSYLCIPVRLAVNITILLYTQVFCLNTFSGRHTHLSLTKISSHLHCKCAACTTHQSKGCGIGFSKPLESILRTQFAGVTRPGLRLAGTPRQDFHLRPSHCVSHDSVLVLAEPRCDDKMVRRLQTAFYFSIVIPLPVMGAQSLPLIFDDTTLGRPMRGFTGISTLPSWYSGSCVYPAFAIAGNGKGSVFLLPRLVFVGAPCSDSDSFGTGTSVAFFGNTAPVFTDSRIHRS